MYWRNSQFQVVAFILGKTHTPDEAYRVLLELREEREAAYSNVQVSDLRTRASIAKAKKVLEVIKDESERLEAEATLLEIELNKKVNQACIDEAKRELEFIDMLIARVQPHRKYKHLPDHEAHQMTQAEEWKFELMTRAENYLSAQGQIPADHFATMRLHPAWESDIQPRIQEVFIAMSNKTALPPRTVPMAPVLLELNKEVKLLGN